MLKTQPTPLKKHSKSFTSAASKPTKLIKTPFELIDNKSLLLFRLSKKTEYLSSVWFFLFSQFSPIEIIVFNKIFLYPIEDIDFLSSNENVKRYFISDYFLKVLGGLKIAKFAMFWTKLCAL